MSEKIITAEEARNKLLEIWNDCEFGIKERVKKIHSYRMVHYILSTPTYSKTEVILEVIETVKEQAALVQQEAIAMNEAIKTKLQ